MQWWHIPIAAGITYRFDDQCPARRSTDRDLSSIRWRGEGPARVQRCTSCFLHEWWRGYCDQRESLFFLSLNLWWARDLRKCVSKPTLASGFSQITNGSANSFSVSNGGQHFSQVQIGGFRNSPMGEVRQKLRISSSIVESLPRGQNRLHVSCLASQNGSGGLIADTGTDGRRLTGIFGSGFHPCGNGVDHLVVSPEIAGSLAIAHCVTFHL
jgi:hypothetical protein